jgi:hypothetical protein
MTDYTDKMHRANAAIYDALKAALNEDGAPVEALKEIAAEWDHLIDHGCTRAEMKAHAALYRGAKAAGLTMTDEEYREQMRDAGRGDQVK